MGSLSTKISHQWYASILPIFVSKSSKVKAPSGSLLKVESTKISKPQSDAYKRELDQLNREKLQHAFYSFDSDHSGSICRSEFRDILRALGHNPSENEVNDLMAVVISHPKFASNDKFELN